VNIKTKTQLQNWCAR